MNYIIINTINNFSESCSKCVAKHSKLINISKQLKFKSKCPGIILYKFINKNNSINKANLFIKQGNIINCCNSSFCLSGCHINNIIYKLVL